MLQQPWETNTARAMEPGDKRQGLGWKDIDSDQEMASWIDEKDLKPVGKSWASEQEQDTLAPP